MTKSELDNDLELAHSAVMGVFNDFYNTGKLLSELNKKHDGFINELHKRFRMSVSITFLRRMIKCGEGLLLPQFVVCVGAAQPWIEKLSIKDQGKIVNGIKWPLGDGDHRIRMISELDYDEAKALFSNGVIADDDTILRMMRKIKENRNQAYAQTKKISDDYERKLEKSAKNLEKYVSIFNGNMVFKKDMKVSIEILVKYLQVHGIV